MLATILVGGFLVVLSALAVLSGLSCLLARGFWWRLYNKTSALAPGHRGQTPPRHRPLWWEINSIAGGLVQIAFGLWVAGSLLLAALRAVW